MEILYSDQFTGVLDKLQREIPEIKAAIITSRNGNPLTSILPLNADTEKWAGLITALLLMSHEFIKRLKIGNFKQISIEVNGGFMVGFHLSSDKLLMIYSTKYLNQEDVTSHID